MLFPKKLSRDYAPEELVEILNAHEWVDGGKFEIVQPDTPTPKTFALGYITYVPCEDYRFAVTVTPFNVTMRHCRSLKAELHNLSDFKKQMTDSLVGDLIGGVAGRAGRITAGIASGAYSKQHTAEKLAKQLNKEIIDFLKSNPL